MNETADSRREYRAWITDRARGTKHVWIGHHPNIDAAYKAALKRWPARLVSVKSIPTPDDATVERKGRDQ